MTRKADPKMLPGLAQDAFHYALAACRDGVWHGYETVFTRGRTDEPPAAWYRRAVTECARARIPIPAALRSPAASAEGTERRAALLAAHVYETCARVGWNAYTDGRTEPDPEPADLLAVTVKLTAAEAATVARVLAEARGAFADLSPDESATIDRVAETFHGAAALAHRE